MAINKATRLSKVAREFNVGLATIVDFLKKKGHEVELNPNTKITPDLYELVAKEYSSELSIKKESEKLSLKNIREKKEAVSVSEKEEAVEEAEDESDEPDEEEVLIKDTREKSVEEEKPIAEKKNLKVVGKIDLDAIGKKAPPKKEEEPAKAEPEQETQPVEEPKQEEKPKEEEKPAPAAAEKPETPLAEKKEKKEEIKEEKAAEEPPKPEEKAEKEKTGPRIVGKIDLNPPRPKAKPAAKEEEKAVPAPEKTEEQKATPKEEKKPEPKQEAEKSTPAAKADAPAPAEAKKEEKPEEKKSADTNNQFIQTDFKKLSGPTVVGRINLPEKQEKRKPVASSRDDKDKRKRKRKRIRVENNKKVPVEQQQKEKARTDQQDAKSKARKKRKPARQEVSEEDVQKQIKDTLARLTSKGSKSKGAKYRREKRDQQSIRHQEEMEKQAQEKNVLKVTEFVSVNELANMMDVAPTEVISICMNLGLFVSINQRLDAETMALVADEFDYKVEFVSIDLQESIKEEEDDPKDLESRPPIVTVMGHVDHGKTKLLDYIRHTNVIGGEAGGITQHIGAYSVQLDNGKQMTFLDTPGHEAFTAMRARGAQITDVAIIVVAADDGVMPQTVEAINHAHAAGVPIVFAINKIDKPTSNVEKIKEGLANMNFLVEDWGGKYQSQEISALNGINIEELLEKVLLEAELLELKANPNKRAKGTVIESTLDRGRGYVATVLVEAGTLNMSDMMLAGSHYGHVKAMYNERGKQIDKAGPATPVLILGLNGAPQAGDDFHVMETDREAKEIANKREQLQREQGLRTQKHITLDEIGRRIAIGNFQELNVIVKGDVDGSVEALSDSLIKLSTEEIQVNVIHKAVGQISESDILLAVASNAIIIGFQVRPSLSARKLAEKEEIDIRLYSIIYDAINELRDAMEGMLSPDVKENITATLEIREVFKITKVGTIAGCIVREGKINRNSKVRVIREGIVVYTGDLGSLKRFKEDVREVGNGYECGLNIANFNDIKVGDIVESFEEIEVKKKL